MGIIIIIIFLMISRTLTFYTETSEMAEKCIKNANKVNDTIKLMRIERLVGKLIFD